MTVRLLGFVFGAVLAVLSAMPAHAERRVALVIGNAGYKNVSPLPNTLNDANAVAKLFRSVGFDIVQLQTNLGILEFKRAVRDFLNTAQDSDIAVVYYAGHGIEFGGGNYMVPVDATLARDYDVEDEAVALDRVIWALQSVRRLRLIIVDACRDNPFLGKMQRSVSIRAASVGLAKVDTGFTDTLVAFAAKSGSVSFDGTGPNSPFTTALVKHLGEPGLDIRIALGRVRDEVLRATENRQEPFVYGSLGGATVSLVPATETPKVAAPAPPPVVSPERQAQQNYEFAERIGTREAWESFLANYGTGFYADLARAQLEKLGRPRPATGTAAAPPVPPVPPVLAKTPEPAPAPKPAPSKEQQVAKLEPPPPREQPPRPVAPPVQANAPVLKEVACKQEAAELARLRANPVPDELIRFERDLVCDSLRTQVQRLRESVTPNTTVAAPQASKSAAAAAAAAVLPATSPALAAVAPPPPVVAPPTPGRQEPAKEKPQEVAKLAPPPPARDAPANPAPTLAPAAAPLVPPAAMEAACRAEGERLAKLRAEPNYDELVKFERDLVCARLKPQVQRLRESLMPGTAAVLPPPAAPPPAVAPPPAIAMPAPHAPAPVPPPDAGTTTTAARGSMAACGRDGERLARLRANPSRDALATFERELGCEQLRPQLQRLKESLLN